MFRWPWSKPPLTVHQEQQALMLEYWRGVLKAHQPGWHTCGDDHCVAGSQARYWLMRRKSGKLPPMTPNDGEINLDMRNMARERPRLSRT